MKLILLSPVNPVPDEHEIINSLFEQGLENFHVNKPDFSKEEIADFIRQIQPKYHNRIALHTDFAKFHSLQDLEDYSPQKGAYAFLSPIFDSISKEGYKSKFSTKLYRFSQIQPELISAVRGKNIIALGGIDEDKIELTRKVGFAGVGVLGAVWNGKNPVAKFKKIKAICEKNLLSVK